MIVWCGNLTILLSGLTFHCFWYRKQKTLCDSLHRPSRSDFVQLEFMVQGIQAESDNLENEVKSQVFENTENKSLFFKYSYTILAIIVGIFAVGVILKVSIEKHRSKNRLDSRWKRKNIRRKRR